LRKGFFLVAPLLLSLSLVSCVDISADILIRRNGSGTLTLEYGIPAEIEALGKQEGNSRWLPVPVGPADFERSAARIDGLRLRSAETRNTETGTLSRVRLDFERVSALLAFLDGLGAGVTYFSASGGINTLHLSLIDDAAPPPEGLSASVEDAFQNHHLELRFRLPTPGTLSLLNAEGMELPAPPGWTKTGGAEAAFRAPLSDLLLWEGKLYLVISWPE
jgi:hypothetical protein